VVAPQRRATSWPERLGALLTSWVDRLPTPLRRVLPKELVGFAILGACTFAVDLALLWFLRTHTPLPMPAAVTGAYLAAFLLNFALNRTVNFRSHAPVGRQALRYAIVVACDYAVTVGATSGLTAAGWDFRLARLTAATCVALFTYTAARWWVFKDRPGHPGG
jgi:putative flippase GtrA